ncbi:hypothetical protein J6590_102303, partial [Homalodisca vitripennis]
MSCGRRRQWGSYIVQFTIKTDMPGISRKYDVYSATDGTMCSVVIELKSIVSVQGQIRAQALSFSMKQQASEQIILMQDSTPTHYLWEERETLKSGFQTLISLLYKDQHSNTLYKLLNIWCDTALTESSEDDESNTSPQDQASGDSSSMATSDPTSDSSDSDHQKHTPKSEVESKHQCHPKQV